MTSSNDDKNKQLVQKLENNFNFDLTVSGTQLDTESEYFKYLKTKLAERIKFFIRTDMDKLLQALYRIDVNDRATDVAFELGEINQVSNKLAELIIIRQLQKLEYAKHFHEYVKGEK